MRVRRLAITLLLCTCGYLHAGDRIQVAFDRLSKIDTFALGPVGYAAEDSAEEAHFWILMGQPDVAAMRTFEKLYSEGNLQAKTYALVGFRILNPRRFTELLAQTRNVKGKVHIQRGCIISDEEFPSVAAEIDRGEYDRYLNQYGFKIALPPRSKSHDR